MDPYRESQKLIQCRVVNTEREESTRFVEFDQYRLWEYLMTHKHELTVSDPVLCLWLSEEDFQEQESLYEHAGPSTVVNRIVIDMFDRHFRFTNTVTRYVLEPDTEKVLNILRGHVPADLVDSDDCNFVVIPGRIVQNWQNVSDNRFMVGLG
jgi:hypothetical protein